MYTTEELLDGVEEIPAEERYTGPLCYMFDEEGKGWHFTVVKDENDEYDVPGEKLYSDGRGNYRLATDDDEDHHGRFHRSFATVEMEDGTSERVTPEEYAAIRKVLQEMRGGE